TEEAVDRIEQKVRPDDQQRAELDALRDATAKAADELRNACPAQTPITPVARLDAMAKRIQAMLDAIKTVRPALARLYASLSDHVTRLEFGVEPGGDQRRRAAGDDRSELIAERGAAVAQAPGEGFGDQRCLRPVHHVVRDKGQEHGDEDQRRRAGVEQPEIDE